MNELCDLLTARPLRERLAGHGRLLLERKLQLREVPVIVLDHLSEVQKRAYIS
jgi:ParB-like chromosome segregation protein Spo0J